MRRRARRGGFALCVLVAGSAPVIAQEAGPVSIEVSDCIELATPAERLACFESRVDEVRAESAPPAAERAAAADESGTEAAEVEAAAEAAGNDAAAAAAGRGDAAGEAALDGFGLPKSDESGFERDEMTATIASVRTVAPNRHVITLDNGQVWRQVHPERYRLRPGQHARIYSTRWGASYRLSVEELRGFIQVQRVQ